MIRVVIERFTNFVKSGAFTATVVGVMTGIIISVIVSTFIYHRITKQTLQNTEAAVATQSEHTKCCQDVRDIEDTIIRNQATIINELNTIKKQNAGKTKTEVKGN